MGHLKNHPVLITTHAEKKRRHIILIKLFFKGFQKEYYSNGLFIYSAKTRLPAKTRHRRVDEQAINIEGEIIVGEKIVGRKNSGAELGV
jgi:hypothetical protein